jgi:hypothetical protein
MEGVSPTYSTSRNYGEQPVSQFLPLNKPIALCSLISRQPTTANLEYTYMVCSLLFFSSSYHTPSSHPERFSSLFFFRIPKHIGLFFFFLRHIHLVPLETFEIYWTSPYKMSCLHEPYANTRYRHTDSFCLPAFSLSLYMDIDEAPCRWSWDGPPKVELLSASRRLHLEIAGDWRLNFQTVSPWRKQEEFCQRTPGRVYKQYRLDIDVDMAKLIIHTYDERMGHSGLSTTISLTWHWGALENSVDDQKL